MARIVNEVRDAILAKLEPIKKSAKNTAEKTTKKVEEVVGKIKSKNKK